MSTDMQSQQHGTLNRPAQAQAGVTLLEMIVVMVLVGILGLVTLDAGMNQLRVNQLSAARADLAEKLEEVRSSAVRSSKTGYIEFDSAKDATKYRMVYSRDGQVLEDTGLIDLPKNTTVTLGDGTGDLRRINYSAPYGELSAPDQTITLKAGTKETKLYLAGVTGKVIQ